MSSDLYLEGKRYISSRRAAAQYGYTQDYVGQLIRSKKVDAKMIGRSWYVCEESLAAYQASFDEKNLFEKKPETADGHLRGPEDAHQLRVEKAISASREPLAKYSPDESPLLPELKKKVELKELAAEPVMSKMSFGSWAASDLPKKITAAALSVVLVSGGAWVAYPGNAKAAFGRAEAIGQRMGDAILAAARDFSSQMRIVLDAATEAVDDSFDGLYRGIKIADRASRSILSFHEESVEKVADVVHGIGAAVGGEDRRLGGTSLAAVGSSDERGVFAKAALGVYRAINPILRGTGSLMASFFDREREAETIAIEVDPELEAGFKEFAEGRDSSLSSVSVIPAEAGTQSSDSFGSRVEPGKTEGAGEAENIVANSYYTVAGVSAADVDQKIEAARLALEANIRAARNEASRATSNTRNSRDQNNVGEQYRPNIREANITDARTLTVSGDTTLAGGLTGVSAYFSSGIGIGGDLTVAGSFAIDSAVNALGTSSAPAFVATSTTATSTFAGGFAVDASGLVYQKATGNVGIGTANPSVRLDVSGRAQFVNSAYNFVRVDSTTSDAYFRLAANGTDRWYFRNNVSRNNNLEISADAGDAPPFVITQAHSVGIGTTSPWALFSVSPNGVSGPSFAVGSSTKTDFVVTNGGLVGVGGTTTPAATLGIQGSAYISGDLTVGGDSVTLGNSTSNTLTINSAITSDIVPDQNATYSLGSPSYFWNNVYVANLNANNISAASTTIAGTSNNTLTINSDNVTADTEDQSLIFYRGTVVPNALLSWNSVRDRFEFNQPLYIENASGSTTIATLDLKAVAGQTGDLLRVASSSGSYLLNLTSGGNLGIGSSTPNTPLVVNGNITMGSRLLRDVTNSSLSLLGGTAKGTGGHINLYGEDSGSSGKIELVTKQSAPITFENAPNAGTQSGQSEFARFTSGGSLGLASTSPWAKLSIHADGLSGPAFAIGSSTKTDFVVTNGGLVGIGTSNPQRSLHVFKEGSSNTALIMNELINDSNGVGPAINFDRARGTAASKTVPLSADQLGVIYFEGWDGGEYQSAAAIQGRLDGDAGVGDMPGRLAFYTAADGTAALAERMRIDNAGNLGIGTTSPGAKLSVAGNSLINGNLTIRPSGSGPQLVVDASGSGNDTEFRIGDGLGAFWNISRENSVGNPNEGDLTFESSSYGTVLSLENANGNVGIGTTSPYGRLSVAGNVVAERFVATSTSATSTFSGGARIGTLNISSPGFPSTTEIINTSNTAMYIGNNNTRHISISNTGEFEVNGGTVNYIRLNQGNGTNPQIWMRRQGVSDFFINGGNAAGLYMQSNQPLLFSTNAIERMRISETGNIGIGSTTPWAQLSVNPNGVTGPAFAIGSSTKTDFIVTNGGNVGIGTVSPAYPLQVGSGTITPSGGFGSTNALVKQLVADTTSGRYTQFALQGPTNGGAAIQIYDGGGIAVADFGLNMADSDLGFINRMTSGIMQFYTHNGTSLAPRIYVGSTGDIGVGGNANSSPNLKIMNLGNVGIGTSSPSAKLEVGNSSTGGIVSVVTNSNSATGAYAEVAARNGYNSSMTDAVRLIALGTGYTTTGGFVQDSGVLAADSTLSGGLSIMSRANAPIRFYTNGHTNERMRIDESGNVGIGTTTPGTRLMVTASGANGIALDRRTDDAASSANLFFTDSGGTVSLKTSSGRFGIFTGATVGSASGSERFSIDQDGDVGIGTTNPSARLDLSASYAGSTVLSVSPNTVESLGSGFFHFGGSNAAPFFNLAGSSSGSTIFGGGVNGESFRRLRLTAGGEILLGGGSVATDVRLFRQAADMLGIDDSVYVNGNVGIGTTTPSQKLSVQGNGLFSGDISAANITATGTVTVGGVLALGQADVASAHIDSAELMTFNIDTDNDDADTRYFGWYKNGSSGGGTSLMRLTESGSLGIGTTSPFSRLSVTGTATNDDDVTMTLQAGNTGERSVLEFVTGGTLRSSISQNANYLAIGTSTNRDQIVLRDGNVGVGVTSPARKLDVYGSGQFKGASGVDATIWSEAVTGAGGVGTNGNYPFVLMTNGSERVRVDTDGDVGIGTASPIGKFEVATNNATQIGAFSVYSNTSSHEPLFYFRRGRGTLASPAAVQDGDILGTVRWAGQYSTSVGQFTTGAKIEGIARGTWSGSSIPTDIAFYTTAASSGNTPLERLRITSDGNIGIGTTTPSAPLHVQRGSGTSSSYPSGTWAAKVFNQTDAISENGLVVANRWAAATSKAFEVGSLWDGGNGFDSFFTVTGAGNVGVGTDAPRSKLDVRDTLYLGTPGSTHGFINSADGIFFNIDSDANGSSENFIFATDRTGGSGGSELVRITGAGNVGIGTTSPSSPLSVSANNFTLATFKRSGSGGGASIKLENGDSNYWRLTSSNTSLSNRFSLFYNSDTAESNEFLVVSSAGNVGIGTTSPSKTLHVNDGAIFGNYYQAPIGSMFSTDANAQLVLGGAHNAGYNTGNNKAKLLITGHDNDDLTSIYPIYVEDENGLADFWLKNRQGGSSLPTAYFGGNVGIGTTSPYTKLAVVGEAVARNFTATSTTATSTFAGGFDVGNGALRYDFSSGVTSIDNATIGSLNFETNAGIVSWADMLVTSAASAGTVESYTASINGNPLLTIYSESDGAGGIQNSSVAIGTSTPSSARLYVEADDASNSSVTTLLRLVHTTSGAPTAGIGAGLTFHAENSVGINRNLAAIQGVATDVGSNTDGKLVFQTADNTNLIDRVTITETGNMSVGSSTARALLDVGRNAADSPISTTAVNGKAVFGRNTEPTNAALELGSNGATYGWIQYADTNSVGRTAYPLALNPLGGNVGIGTTTPSYKLDLWGSANAEIARFTGDGSGNRSFGIGTYTPNSGGANLYVNGTAAVSLHALQGLNVGAGYTGMLGPQNGLIVQGSVGIGTTNPAQKLDVTSSAASGEVIGLRVGQGISGTNYTQSNLATGLEFVLPNNIDLTQAAKIVAGKDTADWTAGTSRDSNLQFYTRLDNAINERMRIDSNGNVGIGTTSPYAKLAVVGEAVARNFTATSTTATSTFAGGFDVGNGAIRYDFSSGATTIENLELGNMTFESDAGVLTWTDLPVTSASAAGTKQSYTAGINGNSLLTVYGESDGAGGVQNLGVGIGSTTPWAHFSINPNNIGSNRPLFNIGSSTASQFLVNTSGNVGIGTTSPQRLLHVYRSTDGAPVRFEDANGYCEIDPTTTTWTCTSDRTLKKDIENITASSTLQRIAKLQAVSFRWNKETENDPLRYGFIAQDVEAVFPELVATADNGLKSVMYGGFTPFLVEAIKELDLSIDGIGARLATVEGKVTELEAMLANISRDSAVASSSTAATSTLANASSTLETVQNWLASVGATIENAVATFVAIVADTVTANFVVVNNTVTAQAVNAASVYAGSIQVGTTTNPGVAGITTVDRITGQLFCIYIANGVMQSAAGACDNPNSPANWANNTGGAAETTTETQNTTQETQNTGTTTEETQNATETQNSTQDTTETNTETEETQDTVQDTATDTETATTTTETQDMTQEAQDSTETQNTIQETGTATEETQDTGAAATSTEATS